MDSVVYIMMMMMMMTIKNPLLPLDATCNPNKELSSPLSPLYPRSPVCPFLPPPAQCLVQNTMKENLVVQYSRQGLYHQPLSYHGMCILSSYGQLKEMLTICMSTERTFIDVPVFLCRHSCKMSRI